LYRGTRISDEIMNLARRNLVGAASAYDAIQSAPAVAEKAMDE